MRLTKRGRGLVVGLLAAVGIGSAFTIGHAIEGNPEASWNKCEMVQAGQVDNGTYRLLLKKGWMSDPLDGRADIYSPACGDVTARSAKQIRMQQDMVNRVADSIG
jgi:hypothetical protein